MSVNCASNATISRLINCSILATEFSCLVCVLEKLEEITGLPSTSLSPQLNRLRKNGQIVESKSSRAHKNYLLAERFYNIWYLMRHGTRRGRRRVKWLTAFLTSYYAPEERVILAERLLRRTSFEMSSHPYLFAVSETLDDDTLKLALTQKISEEILTGNQTRQAISRIVRLEEVNPIILERGEILEKLYSYNKIHK